MSQKKWALIDTDKCGAMYQWGGGTLWKMGVLENPPAFRALILMTILVLILKTLISAFFSSEDPTFTPKSQIFRSFKLASKLAKSSIQNPQTWLTSCFWVESLRSQIRQWSIHKPLCSDRTTIPKWKLSAPSPAAPRILLQCLSWQGGEEGVLTY